MYKMERILYKPQKNYEHKQENNNWHDERQAELNNRPTLHHVTALNFYTDKCFYS